MNPLQALLASINIIVAATYPFFSFQHGIIARIAGVSCGILAISLSRNGIFQPIVDLNNQRWFLRKEVKQLESKIQLLKRQLHQTSEQTQAKLQEIAEAKQAELDEREQAIVEAEKELAQSIEAANKELEADKKKFLEESEQAIARSALPLGQSHSISQKLNYWNRALMNLKT